MLAGTAVDRASLFADLLMAFDSYYGRFLRDGFGAFVASYEERMVHGGARVRFERGAKRVVATTVGVAADGALRVVPEGGTSEITLYTETVELLP
jgi:biotin-(acetyl-CoA carboxylase) ligase